MNDAAQTHERIPVWGFEFEPATGRIFDAAGQLQPFTFQDVSILDTFSGRIVRGNPLQFATRETAGRVLAHLRGLFPAAELTIEETVWTCGPFLRSAVEFGIRTPSGTVLNCGLLANTMMRAGALADSMLRAELQPCLRPRE